MICTSLPSREPSPAERRERLEGLHDLVRAIRDCWKPVIAAVEGGRGRVDRAGLRHAGGGNAFFSVAYVKVGLSPDGGATAFLSEFVSRQLLTELCLTGELSFSAMTRDTTALFN